MAIDVIAITSMTAAFLSPWTAVPVSTCRTVAALAPLLIAGLGVLGGLGIADAQAQDSVPVDLEMVRPGLSPHGGFALDAPHAIAPRTWSVGGMIQYENAPLRLFDDGELVGPLVAHRTVLQLHGGVSFSRRTSLSLMLPVGIHFGADGEIVRSRNGGGLGDGAIALRVHAGPWKRFHLGVMAQVFLPTGNTNQYMGERLPRLRAGLLGYTHLGRVKLLTNLLAHVRERVETPLDFVAGSELEVDIGLIGHAIPATLDVIAEWINKIGVEPGDHGGRLSSELVAGVRYRVPMGLRVDLAVGKGLTGGYGTTGVRAIAGLSFVHLGKPKPKPAPEPPPPIVVIDTLPEAEDEPPPPPPPAPPPVAALVAERIEIRDPIEFEQGTTTFRPQSQAVLDAVAEVILTTGAIGHVVIEGHASQEGGYRFNYDLSRERARAIYEAMVVRGVHPARMSYRGAGEVERVAEGDDEVARERNRRVVFDVVRTYAPGEAGRELPEAIQLPWSGEDHTVHTPPPPDAPEALVVPTPSPEPAPAEVEAAPSPYAEGAFAPVDEEPVFDDETETETTPDPVPDPVPEAVAPVPDGEGDADTVLDSDGGEP